MVNVKFWCLIVRPEFVRSKLLGFMNCKRALQALLLTTSLQVCAGGLESLELFLKTAHSGRAIFSQVVTPPVKAGQTARSKNPAVCLHLFDPHAFDSITKTIPFNACC